MQAATARSKESPTSAFLTRSAENFPVVPRDVWALAGSVPNSNSTRRQCLLWQTRVLLRLTQSRWVRPCTARIFLRKRRAQAWHLRLCVATARVRLASDAKTCCAREAAVKIAHTRRRHARRRVGKMAESALARAVASVQVALATVLKRKVTWVARVMSVRAVICSSRRRGRVN